MLNIQPHAARFTPKTSEDERIWQITLQGASPAELGALLEYHRALIDALKVEERQIEAEIERRLGQLKKARNRPKVKRRR